jgi:hypothetical protein
MASCGVIEFPEERGSTAWDHTLGISQGDKSSADKLARRLGLGMNFKGWRMRVSLRTPPPKMPWKHTDVDSFVFRKQ